MLLAFHCCIFSLRQLEVNIWVLSQCPAGAVGTWLLLSQWRVFPLPEITSTLSDMTLCASYTWSSFVRKVLRRLVRLKHLNQAFITHHSPYSSAINACIYTEINAMSAYLLTPVTLKKNIFILNLFQF